MDRLIGVAHQRQLVRHRRNLGAVEIIGVERLMRILVRDGADGEIAVRVRPEVAIERLDLERGSVDLIGPHLLGLPERGGLRDADVDVELVGHHPAVAVEVEAA